MNAVHQSSQKCTGPTEASPPPGLDMLGKESATTSACSSESRSADTGSPGSKVCVTCGTRKTPMWRTNTDGQKTLCNACGVRLHREQKKAKIARSGTDGAKSKADAEVQLLPRSRSKSQSLTPEAKVAVSGESQTKMQRKRSLEETVEPRKLGARSKEHQGLYRVNSSSAYHELQHQHQQQQQQQQQRPKLAAWRSLNALSEHLGTQELCRLPQSLPVQYSTDMAMSTDADLDPLDPAFLASINDPCSSRKSPFSYDLDATGSCLTEDRSEQTLLMSHAHHHYQQSHVPNITRHYSSPIGDLRSTSTHVISPIGRNQVPLPLDMSTPDSHMWMAQEGYFL